MATGSGSGPIPGPDPLWCKLPYAECPGTARKTTARLPKRCKSEHSRAGDWHLFLTVLWVNYGMLHIYLRPSMAQGNHWYASWLNSSLLHVGVTVRFFFCSFSTFALFVGKLVIFLSVSYPPQWVVLQKSLQKKTTTNKGSLIQGWLQCQHLLDEHKILSCKFSKTSNYKRQTMLSPSSCQKQRTRKNNTARMTKQHISGVLKYEFVIAE